MPENSFVLYQIFFLLLSLQGRAEIKALGEKATVPGLCKWNGLHLNAVYAGFLASPVLIQVVSVKLQLTSVST